MLFLALAVHGDYIIHYYCYYFCYTQLDVYSWTMTKRLANDLAELQLQLGINNMYCVCYIQAVTVFKRKK